MKSLIEKFKSHDGVTIEFVGDSITHGLNHCRAENFGHGDWLANDKDACHPTPKAAHIMAENILDEFLKIINTYAV